MDTQPQLSLASPSESRHICHSHRLFIQGKIYLMTTNQIANKAAAQKAGTREQWLAARLELLEAEKDLTRRSDELAQRRPDLPWVRIQKNYRFDTPASLPFVRPCV
jgi:Bacterial protein of unknown function (DUF899)